jgi:hypothetical protein
MVLLNGDHWAKDAPYKKNFRVSKKVLPLRRNYEIICVYMPCLGDGQQKPESMNAFHFLRQSPPCQPPKSREEASFIATTTPATEVRDA